MTLMKTALLAAVDTLPPSAPFRFPPGYVPQELPLDVYQEESFGSLALTYPRRAVRSK